MPVLKNKTQGNYVNVYKGIVMDKQLSLKDRGMLVTLLSLPDNWNFSVKGLQKILPDGKSAIYNCLDSLQASGYLVKEQSRGSHGVFGENIIEVHETPILPFSENRETVTPFTEKPFTENPHTGNRSQLNNNRLNNQEVNNNPSIHQNKKVDAMDEMQSYMDIVKENIEYECLIHDYPHQRELIDEIVHLIVETIVVNRDTVRIAGANYPYEMVKSVFLKLHMGHIQYVLRSMETNVTKVRNIKNYLLTALYNAPSTMGNYYRSEVNHNMYGGKK